MEIGETKADACDAGGNRSVCDTAPPHSDDLDAEYIRLKLALADARSRSDEQKLIIHKLVSEISSLQNELDVTRSKVVELRSAAEDTTAATEQLRMYADEAAEERDRLRAAADKIACEREELQRKLDALTKQRDDAMGSMNSGS